MSARFVEVHDSSLPKRPGTEADAPAKSLDELVDELVLHLADASHVPQATARRAIEQHRVLVPGWLRRRRRELLILFLAAFFFCLAVGLMHLMAAWL